MIDTLFDTAPGPSTALPAEAPHRFARLYTARMTEEETHIAPMAKRLCSDARMMGLGEAMCAAA